jgi:hypothetical protein
MKTMFAGLGSLVLGLSLSTGAFAQEEVAPPPQDAPQVQPGQPGAMPGQMAPPPGQAPAQGVYSYPTGQWVNTAGNGSVWVPAGITSVAIGGAPYAYLYSPGFGWRWAASPWGWGGYRYGAWVGHPWAWRGAGWRGAPVRGYGHVGYGYGRARYGHVGYGYGGYGHGGGGYRHVGGGHGGGGSHR